MAIATTKMIDNVIDGTTLVQIAQRANQDGNGNSIANSYARTNGNYPNMTVGNATNADTATTATKATQDGGGNNIENTYATKGELTDGLAGKQPTGNYALQNGTYPDMTVGNATNAENAENANTATTATTANHVQNALTFGNKSYNGSTAQEITAADLGLSSALKPQGSIAFANLPAPSASNLGYIWNVTDSFTTDARFLEGAGVSYPAGTNVAVVQNGNSYAFDVYGSFVDLSNYAQINGNYPNMTVGNATNASQLGGVAASSYARTTGTYSGMTVGNATNAQSANTANTANKVANALTIIQGDTTTTYDGSAARSVTIATGGVDRTTVTISTSAWSNNSVTLTAASYPVLENVTTTSDIQFICDNASAASFINNGVDLTGQGSGSITFTCESTPAASISGRIFIYN